MVPLRTTLAALIGCTTVCCGAPGVPVDVPRAPPGPQVQREAPLVTPSRFVRFPECAEGACFVTTKLDLGAGGCLWLINNGDRWLAPRCDAPAERAASARADQPLTGAARTGETFTFVDQRGGLHVASSALGDFSSYLPPPSARLRAAALTASGAVAFGPGGALRQDQEGAWKAIPGAPQSVVSAAALGASLLVLQSPERLFRSDDSGQTYKPVALPTKGATSVHALGGALVAPGAPGAIEWKPGGVPAEVPEAPDREAKIGTALPRWGGRRGPGALAIDGARLHIVEDVPGAADGEPKGAALVSGPLAGPWTTERLPELAECEGWALGAREPFLALACVRGDQVLVYLREGSGKPSQIGRLAASAGGRVALAVSYAGVVLATGVCAATDPQCAGSVVRLVHGEKPRIVSAGVDVEGWSPALSSDGTRAYALATVEKSPYLLVSRDGGLTFTKRSLDDVKVTTPDREEGGEPVTEPIALDADSDLTLGDEGELGVRLAVPNQGSVTWAVLDSDGAFLRAAEPALWYAGYGKRALRLVATYGDERMVAEGSESWELAETEGELTVFEPTRVAVNASNLLDWAGVTCGRAGCFLGPVGVREGWGPALEAGAPPPRPPPDAGGPLPVLVCEVDSAQKKPFPVQLTEVPALESVGHPDHAWWALSRSPDVRLTVAHGGVGKPLRLVEKVLLPKAGPTAKDETFSLASGVVVARHDGSNLEVVWEDVLQKKSGRYVVRGANAALRSADLAPDGGLIVLLGDSLHVVAPGGAKSLHKVPGPSLAAGLPVFATVVDKVPVLHTFPATSQERLVASSFAAGASALRPIGLWADHDWGPEGVWPITLSGQPGLRFVTQQSNEAFGLRIERDGSLGPLEALADPSGLGQTPRACTTAERLGTPRVAFEGGPARFERWVFLAGPDGDWWNASMVVQGTVGSPCLAGMASHGTRASLVVDGDGKTGWLVTTGAAAPARRAPPARDGGTVQALVCKLDPTLRPPADL